MSDPKTITVIGAGVVGLTAALVLSENPANRVLVVAEFMPGDYDIGYASCWAGANFFPMGAKGSLQADLEAKTWPVLKRLAQETPETYARLYKRDEDVGNADPLFVDPGEEPWWNKTVDNFRCIDASALPPGIAAGSAFTTVCINTAVYLPYLLTQCRRRGVSFRRRKLDSIHDAATMPHPDHDDDGRVASVVVNATGLGSRWLKGVEDPKMMPARGQMMLVRNEPDVMMAVSGGKDGTGLGYCMTRASGGGTVMGGCYELDRFDGNPDPNLALRFMKTCVEFCPSLVGPGQGVEGLDVVRHGVGLRPVREGGVRIETEALSEGVTVVHCYGHGGWGYQTSWGSAEVVAKLVGEMHAAVQAKL